MAGVIVAGNGLSPRVRGNHAGDHPPRGDGRSIPACAGEPPADRHGGRYQEVYPRVCGGTGAFGGSLRQCNGLSPRVRGNQRVCSADAAAVRSIPACAGEPAAEPGPRTGRGVYPRVCGGTMDPPMKAWASGGLSPRVRGNHHVARAVQIALGSIPACAGEPRCESRRCPSLWVYPRVCGGTGSLYLLAHHVLGLSPRVRGNHRHFDSGTALVRSIPACAGEPAGAAPRSCPGGVYPRVCGGTGWNLYGSRAQQGLSPRVRGNQCR